MNTLFLGRLLSVRVYILFKYFLVQISFSAQACLQTTESKTGQKKKQMLEIQKADGMWTNDVDDHGYGGVVHNPIQQYMYFSP